jgi:hypothetical protein
MKYFVKNMKYFGIFRRLLFDLSIFINWVLNYFTLFTGIYEMSNRKYKKILYQKHEISRNTWKEYSYPTIFFSCLTPRFYLQNNFFFWLYKALERKRSSPLSYVTKINLLQKCCHACQRWRRIFIKNFQNDNSLK